MKRHINLLFAIGWTAAVLITSLIHLPFKTTLGSGFLNLPIEGDKILHFIAYFCLVVIWSLYYMSFPSFRFNTLLIISTGCILYSIIIETFQIFVAYRTFEWEDIIANVTGAIIASILVYIYFLIRSNRGINQI